MSNYSVGWHRSPIVAKDYIICLIIFISYKTVKIIQAKKFCYLNCPLYIRVINIINTDHKVETYTHKYWKIIGVINFETDRGKNQLMGKCEKEDGWFHYSVDRFMQKNNKNIIKSNCFTPLCTTMGPVLRLFA